MHEDAEQLFKKHWCSELDYFVFPLTAEGALVDSITHGHGHE